MCFDGMQVSLGFVWIAELIQNCNSNFKLVGIETDQIRILMFGRNR